MNRLDEPVVMAGPKPMRTEYGVHQRVGVVGSYSWVCISLDLIDVSMNAALLKPIEMAPKSIEMRQIATFIHVKEFWPFQMKGAQVSTIWNTYFACGVVVRGCRRRRKCGWVVVRCDRGRGSWHWWRQGGRRRGQGCINNWRRPSNRPRTSITSTAEAVEK